MLVRCSFMCSVASASGVGKYISRFKNGSVLNYVCGVCMNRKLVCVQLKKGM